ncbi:hypothetical protein SAMN04489740_4284 [Arthrobacter alpinus]|uniref:HNH nuclease domain-containing protein n=1 Tax=Arthrobacter alpinus TaxID=656366 RepID=A0A1H5PFS4_9MICC|nr:hypothetical protein [Arthrobacter alpinus]SEF12763.1 hypothetical protein SAMN04489740_4284 [Arthrobacter alpinus]
MQQSAVDRFRSIVLKGPGPDAHWLFLGAVADDGYGRYFLRQNGCDTSARPHRYAYELAIGVRLGEGEVLRHMCNIPICVRPDPGHLIAGMQRENVLDRVWDGRHANGATWRWRGVGREIFAARSCALRDAALEHGWGLEILGPLMSGADPDAPPLF